MLFNDAYSLKCKNDELCSCLDVLVNSLWPTDALCWHRTSGNGLVFDGTKTLPKQMLTSYHWGVVAYTNFTENAQDIYLIMA